MITQATPWSGSWVSWSPAVEALGLRSCCWIQEEPRRCPAPVSNIAVGDPPWLKQKSETTSHIAIIAVCPGFVPVKSAYLVNFLFIHWATHLALNKAMAEINRFNRNDAFAASPRWLRTTTQAPVSFIKQHPGVSTSLADTGCPDFMNPFLAMPFLLAALLEKCHSIFHTLRSLEPHHG